MVTHDDTYTARGTLATTAAASVFFVPSTLTVSNTPGLRAQRSKKLATWNTTSHPFMALTSTSALVRSPTTGCALRFSIKVTPLRRRTNPTTRCPRRVSALTRARPRGLAAPVTNARIVPPTYGRDAVETCASRHPQCPPSVRECLFAHRQAGILTPPKRLRLHT